MAEEYPYPSHVSALNFVTVKLSGRDKYMVWKEQVVCLLESHGMMGFVNGEFVCSTGTGTSNGEQKVEEEKCRKLWKRSDAMVKLWIQGSLSEQVLTCVLLNAKFQRQKVEEEEEYSNRYIPAKDIWDEITTIYGPVRPNVPKILGSSLKLMGRYKCLKNDAVLMAVVQNFPSEPSNWEQKVYDVVCAPCIRCWAWGYNHRHMRTLLYALVTFGLSILLWPIAQGPLFKSIKQKRKIHEHAGNLLRRVCGLIKHSNDPIFLPGCYTGPILEAARLDAYEVVKGIVNHFPSAIWCVDEDCHNIIQLAVTNRSVEVYNLLYQMSEHKNTYKTIKDTYKNNLLHLAARLAPRDKLTLISGAALQIQRELQWFQEVKKFVSPLSINEKNSFEETPQMVFTREHKELLMEGEKWMKATAQSYSITAALIVGIVFAAAITVPGGNNQDSGIPVFRNNAAFVVFAISDIVSLFTSTTSLLMFLSIVGARFAEQDFLVMLPTMLLIGLATLFVSTVAMIVAFAATMYLMFGQNRLWMMYPILGLTCLPISYFVLLQCPFIANLACSTHGRSIFGKKRDFLFY